MKYVIGIFALIAAVVIVGCSATTLFWTAFESAQDPWQQWMQGIQVSAVVSWEAAAVLLIGYCFRMRWFLIGVGSSVLLLLAMAYTFTQELRLQVGTQADTVAVRNIEIGDRARVKSELDKAYKVRDALESRRRLSGSEQDELYELRQRILILEGQWNARIEKVRADGVPEADWASRLTGIDKQLWADAIPAIKLLFWMFARVFALPLAIVGWMALRREWSAQEVRKPKGLFVTLTPDQQASALTYRGPEVLGTLSPRKPDPSVERLGNEVRAALAARQSSPQPHEHDPGSGGSGSSAPVTSDEDAAENVIGFPTKAEIRGAKTGKKTGKKRVEIGSVTEWLGSCTSQDGEGSKIKQPSGNCHRNYLAYCKANGFHPVGIRKFTRILKRELGVRDKEVKRNVGGQTLFTGLLLSDPRQWSERRAVA